MRFAVHWPGYPVASPVQPRFLPDIAARVLPGAFRGPGRS